jgi:hypothetical protein
MLLSNLTLKKIDIFWSLFSIVFMSAAIFFWQTGKDYFFYILFAAIGIVNSVKALIPKILFNILRVFITIGTLLYILIKYLINT